MVLLSSLVATLKGVFEIHSVPVVLCLLNKSKESQQITQLAFTVIDSVIAPTKMANKFERSWC